MSIYATWPLLAADTAANAPLVYQGSHVNPDSGHERAGWLEIAAIPNHCHPEVRNRDMTAPAPTPDRLAQLGVEYLRLSVGQGPGSASPALSGAATVVLDRSQVEQLCATLEAWLETNDR